MQKLNYSLITIMIACVFSCSVIKEFWLYIIYNVVWLTCSLNQINNACKWGTLCPGSFTERTQLFCLVHMVRWMDPSCKVAGNSFRHFPAVMLWQVNTIIGSQVMLVSHMPYCYHRNAQLYANKLRSSSGHNRLP